MRILKVLASVATLCILFFVLNTRLGMTPPLGKIVCPFTGFWANAEPRSAAKGGTIGVTGPTDRIVVKYDGSAVPHIFANNDHDLYFAQGYLTAKDRLWQMDMQVRTASGRLSEVLGRQAAARDIFYRRIGLQYAAEKAIDSVLADPVTRGVLEAYSAGVNAYIRQLSSSEYPLEFKIFDYRPEEWKPISSLLVLKLMAETLSGGESEFAMNNALADFGADTVAELYRPLFNEDPVIPRGIRFDFPAASPDTPKARKHLMALTHSRQEPEGIGSNNWAVAGSKSSNGYPLLANDPHLGLTLPSIWYEIQLQSAGSNVYGVSIPGVPCVIIGYNKQIAWGVTNASADVVDWYKVKFKDSSKNEYWYNGKWTKADRRVERFTCRNAAAILDTIVYTHHGPVVYEGNRHRAGQLKESPGPLDGYAMRWTMHNVSNELKTFYLLDRAANYDDYRKALSTFSCPAQNFAYAGTDKNIAITSAGKFPLRRGNRGDFILDGSVPSNDWTGWIPADQVPFVKNPSRGFVSSANQTLTDSSYPYFIGGHFASNARAKRINDKLAMMNHINADSFRLMQNDCYSGMAAKVLPVLLKRVTPSGIMDDKAILSVLGKWDYSFTGHSIAATIFTAWWNELYAAIWNDDIKRPGAPLPWPDYEKTASLLVTDTNSHWIDDIGTPQRETLNGIIDMSFAKTVDNLTARNGKIGTRWEWDKSRICTITHLSGIPSFGIGPYAADGAPNTINALSEHTGPSWRMVVELGPTVKGYGVLPGGESGNPGSFFYDNLFPAWKEGRLQELVFLNTANEADPRIKYTVTLKK